MELYKIFHVISPKQKIGRSHASNFSILSLRHAAKRFPRTSWWWMTTFSLAIRWPDDADKSPKCRSRRQGKPVACSGVDGSTFIFLREGSCDMGNMKDKVKDGIDKAASKTKDMAGKAADKGNEAAQSAGDSMKKSGDKLKLSGDRMKHGKM
jgi:hypothetical protein